MASVIKGIIGTRPLSLIPCGQGRLTSKQTSHLDLELTGRRKNPAAFFFFKQKTNKYERKLPMMTTFEYPLEEWQSLARCAGRSVKAKDIFFSEEIQEIATAKSICADCPVISPCLEGAIGRNEPCGVWGGQLFMNGKVLMVKRRRGRPSKIPRPEEQMPEIPVPLHLQELLKTA